MMAQTTALVPSILQSLSKKGGTGYQPVPLGNLPSGREESIFSLITLVWPRVPSILRWAGRPAAQAGSLCYRAWIFRQALTLL